MLMIIEQPFGTACATGARDAALIRRRSGPALAVRDVLGGRGTADTAAMVARQQPGFGEQPDVAAHRLATSRQKRSASASMLAARARDLFEEFELAGIDPFARI